jgi:hypothetical protein
MKRLLALLFACGAAAAGASGAARADKLSVDVALAPKKIHEECARLEAGQSRRWHWKSSAPVDFNIHYHRGEEVFYPVKRDGMRGDGGTFTARTGEDYCWMWTAKDAPARVEGTIGK